MTREVIRIKFNDDREDIVRRSDCIAMYDTTEEKTVIQCTGYRDATLPTDIIKSITVEYIHDRWIRTEGGKYQCPRCKVISQQNYNFCPCCGKEMK